MIETYSNVVPSSEFFLRSGKNLFLSGKPRPACDSEEEVTPGVLVWMGWGLELAEEFDRRRDVIKMLGEKEPDDLMKIIIEERNSVSTKR